MGNFSGIEDSQVGVGRRYYTQGRYKVAVNQVTHGITRKDIEFFAVESEIKESNAAAFKPGDIASWFVKMTGNDSALGNIKGFLSACLGIPPTEVTEADADAAISQEQPMVGVELIVIANDIITRAGRPFTAVNWYTDDATANSAQKVTA